MQHKPARQRRGNSGTKPKPPLKKPRRRAKRGQAKTAPAQRSFLATVLADEPNITSEQFAVKFNLPIDEVARHRAFILQYTIDYNIKAAALRMGYPNDTAYDAGYLMLNYAFAQLFLSELQRSKTLETVITQGQLASKIVEEMNRPDIIIGGCVTSNSATRLTAAKLLAQMLGILNPKPKEVETQIRRVMIVGEPALKLAGGNMEEWGIVAVDSQKRLRAETVVDV